MLSNNIASYSIKIIGEIIADIIYFPLWWYSRGLLMFLNKLFTFLKNKQKALGLLVWIKNIHRPMYGQVDWQGKLISFLIRLIQIVIRSIIMLLWLILAILLLLFWLILPLFTIYQITVQLFYY